MAAAVESAYPVYLPQVVAWKSIAIEEDSGPFLGQIHQPLAIWKCIDRRSASDPNAVACKTWIRSSPGPEFCRVERPCFDQGNIWRQRQVHQSKLIMKWKNNISSLNDFLERFLSRHRRDQRRKISIHSIQYSKQWRTLHQAQTNSKILRHEVYLGIRTEGGWDYQHSYSKAGSKVCWHGRDLQYGWLAILLWETRA